MDYKTCRNCGVCIGSFEFVCPECSPVEYSSAQSCDWRPDMLKKVLRKIQLEAFEPENWYLHESVLVIFHSLFEVFQEHWPDRKNFLSYAYQTNRILEFLERPALVDRLGLKEPKTPRLRAKNQKLWGQWLEKYRSYIEENGSENQRLYIT